uniref:Crp/Fnr family transcriptional regulator n=1 Tax=Candidatus Kentrum eta TaxID=2126337 RepID=A0A450VDU7_9GAMM|nr:MAG: hypothetical protein BECKH772A_GA0070896_100934 [Candidatus Kentron sp. H]VFJ97703.1 MAG: hypothetical protein BECKH772B_GA0070898_101174 [Candidatus Kentron sp. H]VFK02944.1 MAG: hypothetical protein BECKH772C_GA0070978_101094 [Candidatus Kentron sp. H]
MTPETKRLVRVFSALPKDEKKTLLAFAEFLANRGEVAVENAPASEPLPIPRPDKETVVAAIRRLSRTYPMLDKATMLNETSGLMGEHVLHGLPASEVIDKLEAAFERHYREVSSTGEGVEHNAEP